MPVVSSVCCRPVAAHVLEGHSPEEQRIGVRLIDFGVIAGRVEPALGRVDDAIECDVLRDDQIPQCLRSGCASWHGTFMATRYVHPPCALPRRARGQAEASRCEANLASLEAESHRSRDTRSRFPPAAL
jgi:hypothetical protein